MSSLTVRNLNLEFARLPDAFSGYRIVHVSDLHLQRWTPLLSELRQVLLAARPDAVVITGDFETAGAPVERAAGHTARLLQGLDPDCACYAVLGNHDDPGLCAALPAGCRVLTNEHTRLRRKEQYIVLAGIDHHSPTSWDIPTALDGVGPAEFTILLAHYPHAAFYLPPTMIDLMLCGHTHAGQIRLPWLGSPLPTIDGLPRRYYHGLCEHRGTVFVVNAGVGCSGFLPLRLFCPPEIFSITLTCSGHA